MSDHSFAEWFIFLVFLSIKLLDTGTKIWLLAYFSTQKLSPADMLLGKSDIRLTIKVRKLEQLAGVTTVQLQRPWYWMSF